MANLMLKTLERISERDEDRGHAIRDMTFTLMAECKNTYYTEKLPTIPAGVDIVADFAGDFGMYGVVEVDGALHKVKIELEELHKVDFKHLDARNVIVSGIDDAA